MFAICSAYAALSPPGMEALHSFEVFAVDVGFAESNLLTCTQGYIQVSRVDGRCQSVVGIVGIHDRLIQIVHFNYWYDWPKYLLMNHVHLLLAASQHRRLVIITAFARAAF